MDTLHDTNLQFTTAIAGRTPDNDRVRRSQMYPVLGRIPVELQQHLGIVDDLRDRFRILRAVVDLERLDRDLRPVDVFGVEDLPHRRERARMRRLRQRGKHIRLLVPPTTLLTGIREHLAQRGPESQRTISHGQHRGPHATAPAAAQQIGPRLGGFALGGWCFEWRIIFHHQRSRFSGE